MKKLVLLRHGTHIDGKLIPPGIDQIKKLSEKLKSRLAGLSVAILSSPTSRTIESAEILSNELGMPQKYDVHDVLYTSAYEKLSDQTLESATELVLAKDTEAVIVVTHDNYLGTLPSHFAQSVWGHIPPEMNMPEEAYKPGAAIIIDNERQTAEWVVP